MRCFGDNRNSIVHCCQLEGPSQIERHGIVAIMFALRRRESSAGMPHAKKTRRSTTFRLVCVHRESIEAEPARMRHMPSAAANRPAVPRIDQIEHQRSVYANRGMQT